MLRDLSDLPTPAIDVDEWRAALRLLDAREHERPCTSLEIELDRVCGSPERAIRVLSTLDRWRRGDDTALSSLAASGTSRPVEQRAVPGQGRPVERPTATPTPLRGGRRDLSVVGFLVALCAALVVPAWLAYATWKGVTA